MRICEKMHKEVVTIGRNDTVEKAMKLMREQNIRHLPVVDGGKLTGVLSLSDLRRAMPSHVSTLDVHEATYLFERVKVKDALPEHQKLITIKSDDFIEEAALLMRAYKIGSLPVVDASGALVGIVTESTIFDAFVDVLGVRSSGSRVTIALDDKPGVLAEITEIILKFDVNIERIAMFPLPAEKNYEVVIRLNTNAINPIVEMLRMHGFKVLSAKSYSDVAR
ncbi:MAG: CBS and ACT domain-containing protein [Clostridiales bacterium]|nr:CBS and ACT domain-containing protein [Clostridiales bacterium]